MNKGKRFLSITMALLIILSSGLTVFGQFDDTERHSSLLFSSTTFIVVPILTSIFGI